MKRDIAITVQPADAHARAPATAPQRIWGEDVRRILCIRLDNLGDVLMTTPAMHALKHAYPGRHLTLLASGSGAHAARFIDDIDDVIEYDAPWVKHDKPVDARTDLAMCERLASLGFDAAVIFTVYSQNRCLPRCFAISRTFPGVSRIAGKIHTDY